MSMVPRDSGVSFASFFERCKLPSTIKDACDAFTRSRYPEERVQPAPFQGYCSYTLFVGHDKVVQFRPLAHKLDKEITSRASSIFGSLVPKTDFLGELYNTGLCAYCMTRLSGVSLSDLRAASYKRWQVRSHREQIIRDFAHIQTRSLAHARDAQDISEKEKRTVGSSMQWRLEMMGRKLPVRFRGIVTSLLANLPCIQAFPWVLSHGDFLPSNIVVCRDSGKIEGLIDWAEAEWLPFGVGMYGLEELLGEGKDGHFVYYPEAGRLRKLFWEMIWAGLPKQDRNQRYLAFLKDAQSLGILLWHGIAFDDGKLNRVVEEGKDDGEIEKLDRFFLSPSQSRSVGLSGLVRMIMAPFARLRGGAKTDLIIDKMSSDD
ncbi:hypothetical protein F5Y15DRAFT_107148 [Xylariaceae sp. FL0016]|nr:hypothetical protein F5Y15DRAFT_107148 [Xylariaceae sp. FL0016]